MLHARRVTTIGVSLAIAAVAAGCGGAKNGATTTTSSRDALIADVARYDLTARRPLRVLVGLQTKEQLVSYGTAQLAFARLDDAKVTQSRAAHRGRPETRSSRPPRSRSPLATPRKIFELLRR